MNRTLRHTIAIATILAVTPAWCIARADNARSKRWRAPRTSDRPHIDGRLDDAAWRALAADSRFAQSVPEEGRPPTQRTELRVLHDDENLYIAVRCFDTRPREIVERLSRRDRETDADRVTIDIVSGRDNRVAYQFDVNAAGVLADGLRIDDEDYSAEWNGLWTGAARRDEGGWTAELAIPLTTLRYERGQRSFGFQVRRTIQRLQEVDEWARVPRTAGAELSYYGVMELDEPPRPRRLLQVTPYFASGAMQRARQGALDGWSSLVKIGGDLRLGLTPALTLDVTFHPDFGEVEVDQLVVNLTSFETFYPEKRPFFLESLELFATPIQLFYSRRIGRAPPPPDGETVASTLPDGDILAATKISGTLARGLDVAALDALVAHGDVDVLRDGRRLTIALQPLTNFAVLRLRQRFLARSSIGVMATAVKALDRSIDGRESCVDGELPSATGRCTRDAYAAAVDLNAVTGNGGWSARAQLAGSLIADGPLRVARDGTPLGSGARGLGVWAQLGKHDGRVWGDLEYQGYSPAFDIDDVGYNRQSNLHWARAHLHYRFTRPTGQILDGEVYGGGHYLLSWDGGATLQRQLFFVFDWRFRSFWSMYLELDWDSVHDDLRETGDGARTERTGGFGGWLRLRSDVRRSVVLSLDAGVSQVRHGFAADGKLTVALRPTPAVELDLAPHVTFTYGDPRWLGTTSDGVGARTYYFGDQTAQGLDLTARAAYTFTPTLSLQLYAQLFLLATRYEQTWAAEVDGARPALPWSAFIRVARPAELNAETRSAVLNVNAVLRWEFHPGSTLMAIYTHAQQAQPPPTDDHERTWLRVDELSRGPATNLFLIKLAFLIR